MERPGPGAYAMLVILALVWGGSFLFIKIGVETIPPITLTALRLIAAAIILFIAARLAGQRLPKGGPIWATLLLAALFGNALPFVLISWGEVVIDSGLAAILMAGMPLFTLVAAHVVTDDEKMNGRKLIGVLCGLAGLVVLIGPEKLTQLGDDVIRQLAVAAASICYGIHALIIRKAKHVPGKALAAGVIGASVPLVVPVALLVESPWLLEPSGASLWSALILGIFQTALATLMMFALIQKEGSDVLFADQLPGAVVRCRLRHVVPCRTTGAYRFPCAGADPCRHRRCAQRRHGCELGQEIVCCRQRR